MKQFLRFQIVGMTFFFWMILFLLPNLNYSALTQNNGKGFDVEATLANDAAFGLHNIIERSRAIGGRAKIVSDNKGTVITIEINT